MAGLAKWVCLSTVLWAGCGTSGPGQFIDGARGDGATDGAGEAIPDVPPGTCGFPIPELTCAPPTLCPACGRPGEACCKTGPTCYCQDYGRELCLADPSVADGKAGDLCRSDGSCDTGLACLPFGPASICQLCGGVGQPCCTGSSCGRGLTCNTGCDRPVCY